MTRSVFIGLFIFVLIKYSVQLQCGHNEVEHKCPVKCPADNCPKEEGQDQPCPTTELCRQPECKCVFNTRRAENGTCIKTEDCPPFSCNRPNEEYVACPSYCPSDDCSQATADGECQLFGNILVVVQCSPACRCVKGYWRKNGVCVPFKACSAVN